MDIALYYKNNNTPIPNQIVYMVVGNKKFTYKINKHGTIKDIFVPEKYGMTNFKFLFKGSYIRDKGSKVYLEPVSAYENYLLEFQSI